MYGNLIILLRVCLCVYPHEYALKATVHSIKQFVKEIRQLVKYTYIDTNDINQDCCPISGV